MVHKASSMKAEVQMILQRCNEKDRQISNIKKQLQEERVESKRKQNDIRCSIAAQILGQLYQLHLVVTMQHGELMKILSQSEREVWPLQWQTALTIFRHALKKVADLKYDSDIISHLLDSQALLFRFHKFHQLMADFGVLEYRIKQLKNRGLYTEFENRKMRYYHGIGQKDKVLTQREEYFCYLGSQGIVASLNMLNTPTVITPGS